MILALNIGNSNITFGGYTTDGKLVFSATLSLHPFYLKSVGEEFIPPGGHPLIAT